MKNKEGFTLIELIVVIAILGILAMLIMPNIMSFTKDAQKSVAGQQFKVLDQAFVSQYALKSTAPTLSGVNSITGTDATALTTQLGD
jgi:prepilin-type N-terminal cleavage/methylation domain-containing protein